MKCKSCGGRKDREGLFCSWCADEFVRYEADKFTDEEKLKALEYAGDVFEKLRESYKEHENIDLLEKLKPKQ